MPHSFDHDVPSDWADKADDDPVYGLYKRCGMWTHDEAAILYNVAHLLCQDQPHRAWLDIGAHTGWTTIHAMKAGMLAVAVDPMLRLEGFNHRFQANTHGSWANLDSVYWLTSETFFATHKIFQFAGVCIDGDHEPGEPLKDAQGAFRHLADTGVIIFHDFIGRPVREAVEWLISQGFHCRVYMTPHMVACCWRGDFTPPVHVPDPNLPDLKARCPEFCWDRCE